MIKEHTALKMDLKDLAARPTDEEAPQVEEEPAVEVVETPRRSYAYPRPSTYLDIPVEVCKNGVQRNFVFVRWFGSSAQWSYVGLSAIKTYETHDFFLKCEKPRAKSKKEKRALNVPKTPRFEEALRQAEAMSRAHSCCFSSPSALTQLAPAHQMSTISEEDEEEERTTNGGVVAGAVSGVVHQEATPVTSPSNLRRPTTGSKRKRTGKHDTKLHEAVLKDDADACRKVLREYVVNVDSRNNFGRTCLHWAASFNNVDIMEQLISARCDLEAQDKTGMRPIMMAASHGHLKAVRLLINFGANVHARDKKGQTLLQCAVKSVKIVKFLVETLENVDIEAADCLGQTALHHAALGGHLDTVTQLVRCGANVKATDKRGRTALHCAGEQGHLTVAEFLVGHQGQQQAEGADLLARDQDGNSALHLAIENRHLPMAALLLDAGTPVDLDNNKLQTPLHIASGRGCRNTIELLLQHGSDLNKQCSIFTKYWESPDDALNIRVKWPSRHNNGNTPLHMAVELNDTETVEILINKGANVNIMNKRRQAPIHVAAECGFTDICKLLLNAGANIAEKEQGGRTPLYIAARGSFTAIVDMIIKTSRLDYPEPEDEGGDKEAASGAAGGGSSAEVTLSLVRQRRRRGKQGGEREGKESSLAAILRKVAYQKLDSADWKKLALHWAFTDDQITAIKHQYTGKDSYKEHCHRMLWIWYEGLEPEVDPIKELCDSLDAIEKRKVSDYIRRKIREEEEEEEEEEVGSGFGCNKTISKCKWRRCWSLRHCHIF